MMTARALAAFALAACLASSSPLAAPMSVPRTGTFALTGGTVHVGDGRVLPGATVVLRDGRVESVGGGQPPSDAEVVDCTGRHVTPGLMAAHTTLGLVEIGAVRATRDASEVGDLNPHVEAATAFHPDSELLGVAIANGVLIASVAPRGGMVPGRGAVMLLSGWTAADMAVRRPSALHVAWPSMAINRAPEAKPPVAEQERALKARLEALDDLFDRAEADRAARAAGPAPSARTEDLRLRALEPVLDREIPVVVEADTIPQMRAALAWATRRGLRLVLAGGRDAWRIAGEIAAANVPVIIGDVRSLPAHDHDPYDAPFAQPGKLVEAGVRIAFTVADAAHVRNLPDEAAMGIAFGLSAEDALSAITLWPAQILGVESRVGSLEPGKDGHVVVWSGPPLEIRSRVERVFVRGAELALEDRHTRLYRKYDARPVTGG